MQYGNPYFAQPFQQIQPYQDRLAQLQNSYQQAMPYGQAQIQQPIQQMPQVPQIWRVQFVPSQDDVLIDRTGNRTLGVSDYSTHIISIANNLHGELLNRVFIHELGHCVMFSYGLLPELHRMVKKRYWVDAEEFVCNILADYSHFVIGTARDILGNKFTYVAPVGAERMIA